MNLADLFARTAGSFGDRPALARGEDVLCTYGELAGRAARLAGGMCETFDLQPGDRVALVMRNTPAYVEIMLACWHAGLIVVPVNHHLHPREHAYILGHAGARLAFVTADLAGAVAGDMGQLETVIVAGEADYSGLLRHDPMPRADVPADAIAWLFYTSGTTGKPKGAMLSHGNLLAMIFAYLASVDTIMPGDAIIHAAPMSHGSGLYILPHAARGAVQVVPPSGGFDEAETLAAIAAHPGSTLFAAPTLVRRLAGHVAATDADLTNLKTIVYGGGPMYLADLDRAHEVFGNRLVQIYGQGESPMTISALDKFQHADSAHPRHRQRLASVGCAQFGIDLRIADDNDRPQPPGNLGEILVRGPSVMQGYWRDPAASEAALRGGWLHTGDVGVLDEDGFLTLRDRSKDLIISGGMNIYPREVEEVLLQHEAVAEVSVVGRPHPDWGEEVVAFIVTGDNQAEIADLDAHCLAHIARFKRPRVWRFIAELPKNSYGKVLKTELRRMLDRAR